MAIKTENDVWTLLISKISQILIANSYTGYSIVQSYQPNYQGIDLTNIIFLYRLNTKRYGSQGRGYTNDTLNDNIVKDERWNVQDVFQLSSIIQQDVTDASASTQFDIVSVCSYLMQSLEFVELLNSDEIGILRISDIRVNNIVDDYGKYNKVPSFDFVLTYQQDYDTTLTGTDEIFGDYVPI